MENKLILRRKENKRNSYSRAKEDNRKPSAGKIASKPATGKFSSNSRKDNDQEATVSEPLLKIVPKKVDILSNFVLWNKMERQTGDRNTLVNEYVFVI